MDQVATWGSLTTVLQCCYTVSYFCTTLFLQRLTFALQRSYNAQSVQLSLPR